MKTITLLALFLSTGLFAQTKTCWVTMDDNLNEHSVTFSVKKSTKDQYQVTDYTQFYNGEPNTVEVKIKDGKVYPEAGTPSEFPVSELTSFYKMKDDSQLTFDVKSKSCSEIEKSLIYFLVIEWFYFG